MKKISEPTSDVNPPNLVNFVLPNELEQDIKPSIEKLAKVSGRISSRSHLFDHFS